MNGEAGLEGVGGGIHPPRGGQPPSLHPPVPPSLLSPALPAPGPWAAAVRASPGFGAGPAAADSRFATSEVSPSLRGGLTLPLSLAFVQALNSVFVPLLGLVGGLLSAEPACSREQ